MSNINGTALYEERTKKNVLIELHAFKKKILFLKTLSGDFSDKLSKNLHSDFWLKKHK